MKINPKLIPQIVKDKMQKLIDNKFEVYIIGGACRDLLIGVTPHDWDLFSNATGEDILRVFPKGIILGGAERQEKILTVIVDNIEISSYRSNGTRTKIGVSLKDHCATCDLTINSICVDINGEITDFFNGEKDINQKNIRCVGNPLDRFKEDPLRIMRAVRFAEKYDFHMEAHTYSTIHDNNNLLKLLPKERIKDELLKILKYGVDWLGCILDIICPQFIVLTGLDGGHYHNENVMNHSIKSYEAIHTITNNPLLLLATLFHDIGKGIVVEEIDGNNTFHKHEIEGYKFIKDWMKEYKFSTDEINYVSNLIRCHMYDTKMSKKGYIKLFNRLDDNNIPVEHLLMLRYADSVGNLAKEKYKYGDKTKQIIKMYYKLKYSLEPFKVTDLEINGQDCIKLGYKGKEIGDILDKVLDLIQEDELINDRPKLLAWLKVQK